jgi:hypothetical protein
MGLFEQYPWLLVPIIVLTVEGWQALKAAVKDVLRRRQQT